MSDYNIDKIINLMKKYTITKNDGEIEEQETEAGGGGGSVGYPTVTKWESGVTRGPANQIGLTKWKDIVTLTRGKANTLL